MRIVLAVLLAVAAQAFLAGTAMACKCDASLTPARSLDRADLVFFGTVEATSPPSAPSGSSDDWTPVYWEFSVQRIWKGEKQSRVRLHARAASPMVSDCEFPFQRGVAYLVYAYRIESGLFETNKCGRTIEATDSSDDLKALGEPLYRFTDGAAR